jgi:hypothetical protein
LRNFTYSKGRSKLKEKYRTMERKKTKKKIGITETEKEGKIHKSKPPTKSVHSATIPVGPLIFFSYPENCRNKRKIYSAYFFHYSP